MSMSEVHRTRPGHERRIILIEPDDGGQMPQPWFLAYCTGCAWYQAGDYADIAVEWIGHTTEEPQ